MADKIVNRVANSQLKTIDLEDFYPLGLRTVIDIKSWLFHEQILKETDFRESLKNHDWSQYKNNYVALTCSSDAIIPSWAYMLITTYVSLFAKKVVVGNLKELEAIAAAVIGGVVLTGGFGTIGGIILGTIIFGIAKEAFFYIPGIDGSFYRVFLGAVLVTAAFTNENIRKRIMGNI